MSLRGKHTLRHEKEDIGFKYAKKFVVLGRKLAVTIVQIRQELRSQYVKWKIELKLQQKQKKREENTELIFISKICYKFH